MTGGGRKYQSVENSTLFFFWTPPFYLTHLVIRNLADKIQTFTVVSLFCPISGEATVPVGVRSFGRVWRDIDKY